jgi:hypothetical protein
MRSTIKAHISKSLIFFFHWVDVDIVFLKNIKIQKKIREIKNKIYGQENQKCKEKIRD